MSTSLACGHRFPTPCLSVTRNISQLQAVSCCTGFTAASSIPDGVTAILHWHNSSGRTMVLRSTQSLTEKRTRNIFWGLKAAGVLGWQPVLKSGSLNLLGTSGSVQVCTGIALPFFWFYTVCWPSLITTFQICLCFLYGLAEKAGVWNWTFVEENMRIGRLRSKKYFS